VIRAAVNPWPAIRALQKMQTTFAAGVTRELERAADDAVARARATRLFKDGAGPRRGQRQHLRESIRKERGTAVESRVRATAPHARFVQEGTRAHRIEARPGGTLRFVIGRTTFFRRSVWHPGTKPRPFLTNAAAASERQLRRELKRMIGDVARGNR